MSRLLYFFHQSLWTLWFFLIKNDKLLDNLLKIIIIYIENILIIENNKHKNYGIYIYMYKFGDKLIWILLKNNKI